MTILAIPCSAHVLPSQSIYFLRVNECMRVISTKKARGWFYHPLACLVSTEGESESNTMRQHCIRFRFPKFFTARCREKFLWRGLDKVIKTYHFCFPKTTVTVVPIPKSLSIESSASLMAQMCFTIARPRPVPPMRLE